MVTATMVGVISQVELALVMKDFTETHVKVIIFFSKQMYLWLRWNSKIISTESICPGDGYCNNGWCNVTSGTCSCYSGYEGETCYGKYFLCLTICMYTNLRGISKFTFTDECDMSSYVCGYDYDLWDWCSGQGWCDFCTGTCYCSSYAQGYKCQGKNFL